MSHSPTESASKEEEEETARIRRAQAEMLRKGGVPERQWAPAILAAAQGEIAKALSAFAGIREVGIEGGGPPASIAYLHSVVARGLADSYNYYDRNFIVAPNYADTAQHPALKGVECVQLHYERREGK